MFQTVNAPGGWQVFDTGNPNKILCTMPEERKELAITICTALEKNEEADSRFGYYDSQLFCIADIIVSSYEAAINEGRRSKGADDLRPDYGQIVDLLCDNAGWTTELCRRARALLVEDSGTRFERDFTTTPSKIAVEHQEEVRQLTEEGIAAATGTP